MYRLESHGEASAHWCIQSAHPPPSSTTTDTTTLLTQAQQIKATPRIPVTCLALRPSLARPWQGTQSTASTSSHIAFDTLAAVVFDTLPAACALQCSGSVKPAMQTQLDRLTLAGPEVLLTVGPDTVQ